MKYNLSHRNLEGNISAQASAEREHYQSRLKPDQKRIFTQARKRVCSEDFAQSTIKWFDQHGRKSLPWQHLPTPYRVWVSEVMLQQTQVSTVLGYFDRFMAKFPAVEQLAKAKTDDVLSLWTGLGYYSRARNLHKTAQIILSEHMGQFPTTVAELEALPGIGCSTAGAIISLSDGLWAPILDGNVKRVLARIHCIPGAVQDQQVQKLLWALSAHYTPTQKTKSFNQAMMDIGATICTRSNPLCNSCPFMEHCGAYKKKQTQSYPQRAARKEKPTKSVVFMILKTSRGAVLLEKRPDMGIWGGLWGFPEYQDIQQLNQHCTHFFPQAKCYHLPMLKHIFTHFTLNIKPTVVTLSSQTQSKAWACHTQQQTQWFTAEKAATVGLAAPVKRLIQQLNP